MNKLKRIANQAVVIAESYVMLARGQNKTLQQSRLSICRGDCVTAKCPMYTPALMSCSICGCGLAAKASNPSEHCPKALW